jgi:hypothetical protein
MTEDAKTLTCWQFQARLPELIGSYEDLAADPHLQHCPLCRTLLSDLESIAEAARELFPVVEPPEALWDQIEFALWNSGGPREPKDAPK